MVLLALAASLAGGARVVDVGDAVARVVATQAGVAETVLAAPAALLTVLLIAQRAILLDALQRDRRADVLGRVAVVRADRARAAELAVEARRANDADRVLAPLTASARAVRVALAAERARRARRGRREGLQTTEALRSAKRATSNKSRTVAAVVGGVVGFGVVTPGGLRTASCARQTTAAQQ